MRRRLALLPLVVLLTLIAPVDSATAYDCSTVPVGSWSGASPAVQKPIWCATLTNDAMTTRVQDAQGGWLDDFNHGASLAHFNDTEGGYRVFDTIQNPGPTKHWRHNNHWMVDLARDNSIPANWNTSIGTAISPNQAFHFEGGQLVIETDVAASIAGYATSSGGDIAWPEVLWSTAPAPTGTVVDNLYLYGQYGGKWAGGCRLQAKRSLTCALEADHDIGALNNNDQYPCFGAGPSRLIEMSGFQACGSTHFGGAQDFGAPQHAWRSCADNDPDTNCRDRFRFVWKQDGLVVYVNGVRYFEDSGWPVERQIPASIVNGTDAVYGHFGEFAFLSDSNVYRFHWDRVAVNPHDSSGALLPLSAAESFCPGQPNDTCTAPPPPTPTPSVTPSPSDTPTPTPSPSASPTPTPTPSPTPTPTPTPTPPPPPPSALVGDPAIEGTADSNTPGQAEVYSYTAAASGAAGHLNLYVDTPNQAASIKLGLYSNSSRNRPASLLGQCSINNPVAAAWASCALPSSITVSAGTKYWLAVLGPTGTGRIGYRDACCTVSYGSSSTTLTALPTTWSTGPTWFSTPASIYASP